MFYLDRHILTNNVELDQVVCVCVCECGCVCGWLGEAKALCIMCHLSVQLILAYNRARPAVLAAGKGRGGMFSFLLFLHCHSCSFLPSPIPFISSTTSSVSFLPFSGRQHKMTHKG